MSSRCTGRRSSDSSTPWPSCPTSRSRAPRASQRMPDTRRPPPLSRRQARRDRRAKGEAVEAQASHDEETAPPPPEPPVIDESSIAWRGPPDSEVGKLMALMRQRIRALEGGSIIIHHDSPESLFVRGILANRDIPNEKLFQLSRVPIGKIFTEPGDVEFVMNKVPEARSLPVHKFTIALFSGATGIDAVELSDKFPDLGLTGAPGTGLLFAAKSERVQRSTALHDFTDYLRSAGVEGLNKAVWGTEDRVKSAVVSFVGGGHY
ncbi:MAG: hypothetical protein JNG84_10325 [Archangium sp.]|nr:hypothetical protein [Archangium sp.]